jgi:hypothetical protein
MQSGVGVRGSEKQDGNSGGGEQVGACGRLIPIFVSVGRKLRPQVDQKQLLLPGCLLENNGLRNEW